MPAIWWKFAPGFPGWDSPTPRNLCLTADIKNSSTRHLPAVDVFVTSGVAWGSERDLILNVVADLDWQGIYHRVRMGPGKPV